MTTDSVAALPGAPWLHERRRAAAERLASIPPPTSEEEVWRYSRVDDFEPERFGAPTDGAAPDAELPAAVTDLLAALVPRAGVVVVHNGRVRRCELDPQWSAAGVRLATVDAFDAAGSSPTAAELLGSVATEPVDYFAALNDVWHAEPVLVHVPAGVEVTDPIVVVDWIDRDGAAVFPRLVVRAEANAGVTVLDWHGSDAVRALAAPVIELDAAAAARVRYLNVQDRGAAVWQVASQVSRAERDATLVATQAGLGGDYARTRADCHLVGRGATGQLAALYFGTGDQMLDFRTFQDHAAPDTTSNLLFKGAVAGTSRSVYTGLIRVRPTARGTNAFQTNRNIKLSDHAWAESVPNLEIENNDVRCSHASTVGPVDEDQRFYLESRGVPTAIAERLIVAGFFREVLEQLPVPVAAPLIEARLEARLDDLVPPEARGDRAPERS